MKAAPYHELSNELKLVIDALDGIDGKYYSEPITRIEDGNLFSTGESRSNESTFVTQLASKIENKFVEKSLHIDKYYQTDQPKQLIFKNDNTIKKYCYTFDKLFSPDEGEFFKVPDIVIHAGPVDFDHENQIFLSEVKTTFKLTQKLFDIDLFKSNVYHDELHFQNTAFIIVNVPVDVVRARFRAYKDRGYYLSERHGIYLLIKSSHKDTLKVFQL